MAFDYTDLELKFEQVLEIVGDDLKGIKTGRAKPAMVEDVMVEAYGTRMPLKELASITAPDPHLITVQPWDQSVIGAVEKALSSGQNQFNPSVDGQLIRIPVPALTGEKREELVKLVAVRIESGKQMIRSQRTDTKKEVEAQKHQVDVSEDDIKNDLKKLDEITAWYNEKLEQVGEAKAEELRDL